MRTFADITIDELIRQGKAVLEQSDYEKALDSYTVWKKQDPDICYKKWIFQGITRSAESQSSFCQKRVFRNRIHQKFKECCKRCFTAL